MSVKSNILPQIPLFKAACTKRISLVPLTEKACLVTINSKDYLNGQGSNIIKLLHSTKQIACGQCQFNNKLV